jgi:serine/threonine protein kinase
MPTTISRSVGGTMKLEESAETHRMIDEEIGGFRFLEKIGEGGMGVVYKCIDTSLDRLVAIKMLAPELTHHPELVNRFRAEAKAQANLNHPNIATLYAFLEIEGRCFIVMEYLEGESFEDLLMSRGKLPWKGAVSLTRQALLGLGLAHDMRVVHRDIKPSNFMLTKNGIVKVMDFGIAKVLGNRAKTGIGTRMGTAWYMSPEQILTQPVDGRSDIYSLGVTLYQLLSGRLPFQGDSDFDLMNAHVRTPPPVFAGLDAEIPAEIEHCVMKAMAKNPSDRYQSAEEFGIALEQALAAETAIKDSSRATKRSVEVARLAAPGLYVEPVHNPASAEPLSAVQPAAVQTEKPRSDAGMEKRAKLAGRWILAAALVLYGVSFLLLAVQPASEPAARYTGWFCATESILIPLTQGWKLIFGHPFNTAEFDSLSMLVCGLINPVFLIALLLRIWNRLRKVWIAARWLLVGMMPVCWIVFVRGSYYPREGYFLWTVTILLSLFSAPIGRWLANRLARQHLN